MFNKLKQFKDLRDQAKKMQTLLEAESTTIDKHGVTIKINGKMEILELKVADPSSSKLEDNLKSAFNGAIKEAQNMMAKKLRESGEMPNFGF